MGIPSDVGGMFSAIRSRNTTIASSTVMASDTFSPEHGGR